MITNNPIIPFQIFFGFLSVLLAVTLYYGAVQHVFSPPAFVLEVPHGLLCHAVGVLCLLLAAQVPAAEATNFLRAPFALRSTSILRFIAMPLSLSINASTTEKILSLFVAYGLAVLTGAVLPFWAFGVGENLLNGIMLSW